MSAIFHSQKVVCYKQNFFQISTLRVDQTLNLKICVQNVKKGRNSNFPRFFLPTNFKKSQKVEILYYFRVKKLRTRQIDSNKQKSFEFLLILTKILIKKLNQPNFNLKFLSPNFQPDPRVCHESLMDQIKRGAPLKRNRTINDRSAPKIH